MRWLRVLLFTTFVSAGLMGCGITPPPPPEGPPRVGVVFTAAVDKAQASVGDTLTYTLTLDTEPGQAAEMPAPKPDFQGLAIVEVTEEGPSLRDGRRIFKRVWKLRADLSGSYVLPAATTRWKNDKGEDQEATAPAVFVEVHSNLKEGEEKTAELVDIKGMVTPPPDYGRMARNAGLLLGLLAVGGLGYSLWKRYRNKVPPPPPVPPWMMARQELAALEARGLITAGDFRTHFYILSEIFRRYFERRFQVPALEQTSEEILTHFRRGGALHQQVSENLQMTAQRFLKETDQIKYARFQPGVEQVSDLHQACLNFVEGTTPLPPEEPTRGQA